jgi:NRAMP (natural resistance-associated macrophage protein)-like metal ion transporter
VAEHDEGDIASNRASTSARATEGVSGANATDAGDGAGRWRALRLMVMLGPGLMAMLADTDAGSVITAAQSGARYGYQLVASQVVLIPILYVVQEMTARLGVATGRGHGALIRDKFGTKWALLSAVTLGIACIGALITEFAGLAGVGALVGLPRWVSITVPAVALAVLILTAGYRKVERVGITIGLLELLFVPAAILSHPSGTAVLHGLTHPVQLSGDYLSLLAANVGAVIMPWMVFYQQGALIDKGRRELSVRQALRSARLDTAVGAVLDQVLMISVLIGVAATIGTAHPGANLEQIGDIAIGLTALLGHNAAVVLFGLAIIGSAVIATLVVALAGAWGLCEALGWPRSLNDAPRYARGFYTLAVSGTVAAAVMVLVWPSLVNLTIGVEVMNACLLPIVLGFLLALERRALPGRLRMRGAWRVITYLLTGIVIAFGLYTAGQTLLGS